MKFNYKHFLIILTLLIFSFFLFNKKEGFDISQLEQLETNSVSGSPICYIIKNKNGKQMVSPAFTLNECKHELIKNSEKQQHMKTNSWKLKEISPGIYVFEKISGGECLYLDDNNDLKSFLVSNCKHKNLCGIDLIDEELDDTTKRTYFRVVRTNNGLNIVSLKDDKYVAINDDGEVYTRNSSNNDTNFIFEKI